MEFLELKNISERYMELVNPSSPEKVIKVGQVLGLNESSRVIEFGCGYGEVLALWSQNFGISGVGIDIREHACNRARQKLIDRGLDERIEIVHANAAEYTFEEEAFDVAACIGATFIWDGFGPALQAMRQAIHAKGKLAVGEAYWLTAQVPPEYVQQEPHFHTEIELLHLARLAGFDFEYLVRSSHDDWDRYESGDWVGLLRWIEENPQHPERQQVIDFLHETQELYIRYSRHYLGWAMYVLNPVRY